MDNARARDGAFSLVELLVVVVIIGILAAVAQVGYRRYIGRARSAEAYAMLAEMASKEQAYYLEFAYYYPLRKDDLPPATTSDDGTNANQLEAAFYPVDPDSEFDSVRNATPIGGTNPWPAQWTALGLRPKYTSLFCTYMGNAGPLNTGPQSGTYCATMLGTNVTSPWYCAIGACNLNYGAGFTGNVSVWGLSSITPTVTAFAEGN